MHIFLTGTACYLGYLAHRYEEGSEERTQKLLARYRHAPREWVEVSSDGEYSWMYIYFTQAHITCKRLCYCKGGLSKLFLDKSS